MQEFENHIIDSASPLWLHRPPCDELNPMAQCLKLTFPPLTTDFLHTIPPFSKDLIADLTEKLHNVSINSVLSADDALWCRASKGIGATIIKMLDCAGKYYIYPEDDDELRANAKLISAGKRANLALLDQLQQCHSALNDELLRLRNEFDTPPYLGPAEWKNMARKPLKILRNQGLCGTMNASELWQRAKNTCGWD